MARPLVALVPGSFDPIHNGHLDIIARCQDLFDRVVVGILTNVAKQSLFSTEERTMMVQAAVEDWPTVEVVKSDGLVVTLAAQLGAGVIVRGLRLGSDFDYEQPMAISNQIMQPTVETVFLAARPQYAFISAGLVRELAAYGANIAHMVPPAIAAAMARKLGTP